MLNKLKAALLFAPKDDPRHYLNAIHVTKTHIEACDGHTLIRIEHGVEGMPEDLLIPRYVVANAVKLYPVLEITATHINDLPFTPVGGRFPDINRVIPKPYDRVTYEMNLDPRYLERVCKAAKLLQPGVKFPTIKMVNSEYCHATGQLFTCPGCVMVVMPQRA